LPSPDVSPASRQIGVKPRPLGVAVASSAKPTGTHSVDIDGELAKLDADGYRPLHGSTE